MEVLSTMNIEFLDLILSTCFTLRKIKAIILTQDSGNFNLRPQIHPMVIAPFGLSKSSITKKIREKYKDDINEKDDLTRPAIEGSITKDGDYVPSILVHLGGKILILDEWNNVDFFAQSALLSILENQRTSRAIGFKVKNKFSYVDEYTKFTVDENTISVESYFSCIAYAMEYPIFEDSQKAKALLSRFSPIFIHPTKELIQAITKGEFIQNIENYPTKIERIVIPRNTFMKIHSEYFKYIDENDLYPPDPDDFGYITRIFAEIIRYGTYNYIKTNHAKIKDKKEVIIDSSHYYIDMFDYINTLSIQFTNPKTETRLMQYKNLIKKYPRKGKIWYAKRLGVTYQSIYNYDKKINKDEKTEDD